jgi:excinuclease ABC subunit C
VLATDPQPAVFQEFGPSAYCARRRQLTARDLPRDGKARRNLIANHVPDTPGVYGMLDGDGSLIYVGKSRRLVYRLMSYFPARSSGLKSERVGRHARRLVWETAAHEFLALLRELELIRRFQPRFNVEGRPERQRPAYLCLIPAPAPFFRVAETPPAGCTTWFGPLPRFGRLRDAVEQLNRRFLLRDCKQSTPMIFAEQRALFSADRKPGCLRYEFGTCLAPCAALCTAADYAKCVRRALAFLRGEDLSALDQLERAMRAAADERVFERAAVLRDAWRDLSYIHRSLERLRSLQNDFSVVYELNRRGGKSWVLLRAGHAVLARNRPQGPLAARAMLEMLESVYADEVGRDEPAADLDMLRLVGGWFQQRPEERRRTRTPEAAKRCCDRLRLTRQTIP